MGAGYRLNISLASRLGMGAGVGYRLEISLASRLGVSLKVVMLVILEVTGSTLLSN